MRGAVVHAAKIAAFARLTSSLSSKALAMKRKPPRSLASSLHLPYHWGDGAGLDGLDAAHHEELQREALAEALHAQHSSGRGFG